MIDLPWEKIKYEMKLLSSVWARYRDLRDLTKKWNRRNEMVIQRKRKQIYQQNIAEYCWILLRTPLKCGHACRVRVDMDILTLFLFRETFSLPPLSIILLAHFCRCFFG